MAVDRDYEYEFNGFRFGKGTKILVQRIEGLDLPDTQYADADRPNDHGGFPGRPVIRPRKVTLGLRVVDEDVDNMEALRRDMGEAFQPSEEERPFVWQRPGVGKRMIYARCYRAASPYEVAAAWSNVEFIAEIRAMDPRIFETRKRTLTFGMTGLSGGRTYDKTYDYTYGDVQSLGDVGRMMATNVGSFPTAPKITVSGPVRDATIENVTTGKSIRIKEGLADDESLVLDMDKRSARLNGTQDRRYYVDDASDWWDLKPGDNDIRFTGSQFEENASVLIEWQSAWIF